MTWNEAFFSLRTTLKDVRIIIHRKGGTAAAAAAAAFGCVSGRAAAAAAAAGKEKCVCVGTSNIWSCSVRTVQCSKEITIFTKAALFLQACTY